MKLFVGLGNPGREHAGNRHNIGFMAVDRIAADHGFSPWRARFQGLIAEGTLADDKVVLLKPQTFMNLSGQSVGEAVRFWKLATTDVTVFHDELDLPPFRVRLKQGGGHAGHNGLRSIHQHIGPDYHRVRLGIGHPGQKELVVPWVLADFPRAQADGLQALLQGISAGAPFLAAGDGAKFQAAVSAQADPAAVNRPVPRRGLGAEGSDTAPAPRDADPAPAEARGPLQRLLDRFR